jgi:hypothetical protein
VQDLGSRIPYFGKVLNIDVFKSLLKKQIRRGKEKDLDMKPCQRILQMKTADATTYPLI